MAARDVVLPRSWRVATSSRRHHRGFHMWPRGRTTQGRRFPDSLGVVGRIIMAVEIARRELTAAELRREVGRTRNAKASPGCWRWRWCWPGGAGLRRRRACGMDRQTLRDWVHRLRPKGWPGCRIGRFRARAAARRRADDRTREIVEAGPDPATDGVARWRRIDLCKVVERRFGVRLAERSMGAILRRLGFARLSAPTASAEGCASGIAVVPPSVRGAWRTRE